MPPATTTPGVTRAAFVRKADAACRRFRRRLLHLRPTQGGPDQQLQFFSRMARLMDRSVRDVGRLERPPADAAAIKRYLRAVSHTADLLRKLRRALEGQDQKRVQKLGRALQRNAIRTNRITRRLGFKVCGSGLSPVGPT